jgi:hypothetical protein
MSKRWLNNFIAVCVVILFCAVLLVTAGCAGQGVKLDVETANDKCGTKKVKFSTDYQVEQLEIGRTIEGGGTDGDGSEGCGGGYTVTLGKGTTKDAETGLILEMFRMVAGMAGFPTGSSTMNRIESSNSLPMEEVFEAGIDEGKRRQTQEFNGRISNTQFKVDGAGNVWIDGKINPELPLKQD